jgi:endoglucanase
MRHRGWISVAVVTSFLALGSPMAASGAAGRSAVLARTASMAQRAIGLHVVGNRLINAHGQPVQLHGFNNSGAEYACVEGWGMFDVQTATNTAVPGAQVAAMAKWTGANVVRVSLNEQCWLGLGGVKAQYSKGNYRRAIATYVRQLNSRGFAVILDLHNSAPGNESSLNQEPMPDGHTVTFWRQVAKAFKGNTSVLFDLFNEPFPDDQSVSVAAWRCWRDGGCREQSTNGGTTYAAVGMNRLVHVVREAGAHNVVLLGGLAYASSLTNWLRFKPTDPDHELAASLHIYSFGGCHTLGCYRGAPSNVARHVPLVIGEFGADLTVGYSTIATGCPARYSGHTGFDATFLRWADAHHLSWLAWTWNPWGDCMSLVTNLSGHATTPYGVRIRTALRAGRQTHVA